MKTDFEGITISETFEKEPITLNKFDDTPIVPSSEITLPSASTGPLKESSNIVISKNYFKLIFVLLALLALAAVSLALVVVLGR
jgi:hypothetical protein